MQALKLFVIFAVAAAAFAAAEDVSQQEEVGEPKTDLETAQGTYGGAYYGAHSPYYGGYGHHGHYYPAHYGGYGNHGYGGYGHQTGHYGGHHGGYGSKYGQTGYTSINKVISHHSSGHVGSHAQAGGHNFLGGHNHAGYGGHHGGAYGGY